MFVILVGFLTLKHWGLGWVSTWWLWLLIIIMSGIGGLATWSSDDMEAGADWFKYGRSWVATYELTEIKLEKSSGSDRLELKDADGREAWIKIHDIQTNPELWNLVYNGILHSVHHGGAVANERAVARLQLDDRLNDVSEDEQR